MITWLRKLLLIAIGISFSISAIELDMGPCQNTFFDEYDLYVKEERVAIEDNSTIEQGHDNCALIYHLVPQYQVSAILATTIKYQSEGYYNHYPPKLFLRNSVWRI